MFRGSILGQAKAGLQLINVTAIAESQFSGADQFIWQVVFQIKERSKIWKTKVLHGVSAISNRSWGILFINFHLFNHYNFTFPAEILYQSLVKTIPIRHHKQLLNLTKYDLEETVIHDFSTRVYTEISLGISERDLPTCEIWRGRRKKKCINISEFTNGIRQLLRRVKRLIANTVFWFLTFTEVSLPEEN